MSSPTMSRSLLCAIILSAAAASAAQADISYWDFNVFSRSTIGSSGQAYGSDFQGASGSVGNAYFNGFTVRGEAGTSPSLSRGFYGGGNFTLGGSVAHGGVEVSGHVNIMSAGVEGGVYAGGNLGGTSGTVNGGAVLGGVKTVGNPLTVNGGLAENQPFAPTVNLAAVSAYFLNTSNAAAGMAPTAGYINEFGNLKITASGALTVVNMSLADFTSAWGVQISGNGAVIINLAGTNLSLSGKTWSYVGGASATQTLFNLNQATTLNLTGSHTVNVLAPNADTTYSGGVFTGDLIVGSLMGNGQVNWGGTPVEFVVPSPAGALALLGLGTLAGRRRRRRLVG